MGINAYGYGEIHIKKENQPKAIAKLKTSTYIKEDGTSIPWIEAGWGNPADVDMENLAEILEDLFCFQSCVEENGDISSLDFSSKYHNDDCDVLGLIAEFMEPGATMDFHDDFANCWRFIFDPALKNGYRVEEGETVFPIDIVGNEVGVQHIFKVYICGEGDEPFEVGNATTEEKAAQMEDTLRAHGFAVMPRDLIQLDVLILDDKEINF